MEPGLYAFRAAHYLGHGLGTSSVNQNRMCSLYVHRNVLILFSQCEIMPECMRIGAIYWKTE